jgi:hypothetical protein
MDGWYEQRGLPAPRRSSNSSLGCMADGRVAGFLYLTNSDVAMIEGIISDPRSVPSLRRESTTKLVGYFVDLATNLGYSTIIGISKHPSILKLGDKFGFKELKDYKIIVLDTLDE